MKSTIKKKLDFPETRLYLAFILILCFIVSYFSWPVGLVMICIGICLIYYHVRITTTRREEWGNYIENLAENIEWTTNNAVFGVPMPLVVLETDGSITWYNPYFSELFEDPNLLGNNISDYVSELNPSLLLGGKYDRQGIKQITFNERIYNVFWMPLQVDKGSKQTKTIIFLYWDDITEHVQLKRKYNDKIIVLADVQVDNYDEAMANTEDTKRPVVQAEIEARIARWASSLDGNWKKYDRDKFIIIIEASRLRKLEECKFDILDRIREINTGNQIPVTLSIGVGIGKESPIQAGHDAQSAVGLALGRGGDQAVVKNGDKLSFYGGKNKAVEKRSKVKSRVIANALRQLIEQSSQVFIMSHEMPDLDSIGSALGIYRCARYVGRETHIVLNRGNASVDYLIKRLKSESEYQGLFITGDQALDRMDKTCILVVLDTQRPSFTEVPELINAAEKIVVIDHHRRSAESIDTATLAYLEPYASSTSELVTEITQYFDERVRLNQVEADALLAGMTMDTKSFTFKTGVRTFEAASYLRRSGADPTSVRQLFQDDLQTYSARADAVRNAVIVVPGVAISQCPSNTVNGSLIAAQAADGLLTIRGIHTSFVLCSSNDEIIISGRSLGNINVQLVLEKLGGGGHLTIAGAQLANISIDEAQQKLIEALHEYLKEGESK